MLRLRFIYTAYPHLAKHSGINQFVKYLDRSQFDMKLRPASDSDHDFPIQNEIIRGSLHRAVQARGMGWYKLSDLNAELATLKECCWQHVDVVHFLDGEHAPQFFPRMARLLRRWRPAIVVTYHQPAHLLATLVPRKMLPQLDAVTVVSPEQLPFFEGLVPPEKLHVILHGIDTSFYKPAYALQRNGTFNCITVGHWLRDFPVIHKVATLLQTHRNIHFHVVSPYPTGLEGLPNVTLYKGLDDDGLLHLYQESHLLFLPLIQSTANNSLLEGIACGLPVVSTDLASVRAYVPGEEAMLVQDNDPEQFVNAVLQLAQNPAKCQTMAIAARKRAEELDWRNLTSRYEGVYSKIVGTNGA